MIRIIDERGEYKQVPYELFWKEMRMNYCDKRSTIGAYVHEDYLK